MRNPAAISKLPIMPRDFTKRRARLAAPAFVTLRSAAPLTLSGPRAFEPLRKSPAWIDRDL